MLYAVLPPVRSYTCHLERLALSGQASPRRRKIRLLILSDTHGNDIWGTRPFLPRADVVLHCGDLTNDSRSAELSKTLAMLRAINAPLKLAIPGNHDFNLERGYWRRQSAYRKQQRPHEHDGDGGDDDDDDADIKTSWGLLRRAAQCDNIFLLPQGKHTFILPHDANGVCGGGGGGGVRLGLFASPMTPRRGNWAFQFDRSNAYRWAIPPFDPNGNGSVDVVMTHGPPKGIRDGAIGMEGGAGCSGLLAAVERARPRLHCFGHIHGGWGADKIEWKRELSGNRSSTCAPTLENLVSAGQSLVVASLQHQNPSLLREGTGCFAVDIFPEGGHAIERGAETLFVNAAVGFNATPLRMPWLVDIDLPVATEEDTVAAAETMFRLCAKL